MKQLFLYGIIGDWLANSAYVQAWLDYHEVKKDEEFELLINSQGGDPYEGVAMYNTLSKYNPKVIITGIAASAATLPALVAGKIHMEPGTQFMIHRPSSGRWGDSDALRAGAHQLDKMEEAVLGIYESHCSKSKKEIAEMMKKETFMTSNDMREMGFDVVDVEARVVSPETVEASMTMMAKMATNNINLNTNKPTGEPEMDIKELSAQLNETTTQLNAVTKERDDSRKAYGTLKLERDNLAKENESLKAAQIEMEIDSVINEALERGSLSPSLKDNEKNTLMALKKADEETFNDRVKALKESEPQFKGITQEIANNGQGSSASASGGFESYDSTDSAQVDMLHKAALELVEKEKISYEQAYDRLTAGGDA